MSFRYIGLDHFGTLNDPLKQTGAYSITNMNRRQPNKPLYERSYECTEAYTDLLAMCLLPPIKGTNAMTVAPLIADSQVMVSVGEAAAPASQLKVYRF